jgi:hypothetical protein
MYLFSSKWRYLPEDLLKFDMHRPLTILIGLYLSLFFYYFKVKVISQEPADPGTSSLTFFSITGDFESTLRFYLLCKEIDLKELSITVS